MLFQDSVCEAGFEWADNTDHHKNTHGTCHIMTCLLKVWFFSLIGFFFGGVSFSSHSRIFHSYGEGQLILTYIPTRFSWQLRSGGSLAFTPTVTQFIIYEDS